jgi:alpha-1,6-mannosyltransferase
MARRRLPAVIGALSLLALVIGALLVVLIAAERPSQLTPISKPGFFPFWMVGPLRGGLAQLTQGYDALAWLFSALMGAMYALYILAFANAARLRARWTIAAVLAVHVIFLLSPPLSYTDVFNYINYGRMGVAHGLNPYTTIAQLEPHSDPSFALSNWHFLLSPYGPLFTLFTYALVPLGVIASFWAIKLVLAIASLATLALVWRCAQLLGRSPAAAVAFVGLNPIVLVWGLGADHNDVLMLFFVVLAVYLLLRPAGSSRGAGAALVTAIFIKASAGVILPIFLLVARRRRFLEGGLAAGVLLGIASLVAFGANLPNVAAQNRLVTALGLPNMLGLALGQGGETHTVHTLVSVLFVLAICVAVTCAARRRDAWLTASAAALIALIASLSWLAPWYLLWALPFAALSRSRVLRGVTLVLGAYLLLVFVPATPMLVKAIHFDPEATPLAIEHRAELEALVR